MLGKRKKQGNSLYLSESQESNEDAPINLMMMELEKHRKLNSVAEEKKVQAADENTYISEMKMLENRFNLAKRMNSSLPKELIFLSSLKTCYLKLPPVLDLKRDSHGRYCEFFNS